MRTDVVLPGAGPKLAGHLFTPDGDAPRPYPAVVVGHPGSGVKEQASGLYARPHRGGRRSPYPGRGHGQRRRHLTAVPARRGRRPGPGRPAGHAGRRREGASHVDLYDKDAYVTPAVEKLNDFFAAHLAA
ncbi:MULTISPECIES: hypothetical protein [unclassified Streptomyces]|uniref:hypothetical protein n=1 Tax=unclassified Streptomyces TaxID=2593676 RepID=UPI00380CE498